MMFSFLTKGLLKTFFLWVFIILVSCDSEISNEDDRLMLSDSISSELLIPNSYVFSSIPIYHDNSLYYLDNSAGGLIKTDLNFSEVKIILKEGSDFKSIPKIFYFSIANNYLFAFGNNQCLVYNITEDKFINKYEFPFDLSQQIIFDEEEGLYLTVAADENRNYHIISFDYIEEEGFLKSKKLAQIKGDEHLHYMEYSGWLVLTNEKIFYVKEWVGEVDEFRRDDSKHLRQFQLPFSGNLEENKNYDFEGSYTSNYFQAYSVVSHENKILVLREIDWESELKGEISMDNPNFVKKIRNRVHVFDEQFNLVESFRLAKQATFINVIDDQLFTLNYEDEKLYVYDYKK